MTRLITLQDARDAVDAAIASRGEDYVYQSETEMECTYVKDGKPDCGVGVCLIESWGVPLEFFYGTYPVGGIELNRNSQDFSQMFRSIPGLTFELDAVTFLIAFQRVQDMNFTWGEARQKANASVGIEE